MRRRNLAITVIVTIQLTMIGFLGYRIYQIRSRVLGDYTVSPIKKEHVSEVAETNLTGFYEPVAGDVITDLPDWKDEESVYTINRDTLHERFDYTPEKSPNTFRIITLGDSFTYGAYVDTEANWTEVLEELFTTEVTCWEDVEVINLGVGGYDLRYGVERFLIRGRKYQPDMVIWFVKDDDFEFINEYVQARKKDLLEQGVDQIRVEIKNGRERIRYHALNEAARLVRDAYGEDETLEYQRQAIEILTTVYDHNLVFMTYSFLGDQHKDILESIVADRSDTFLFGELYSYEDEYLLADGHQNEAGNRIIAEELGTYLIGEQLVPCRPVDK